MLYVNMITSGAAEKNLSCTNRLMINIWYLFTLRFKMYILMIVLYIRMSIDMFTEKRKDEMKNKKKKKSMNWSA